MEKKGAEMAMSKDGKPKMTVDEAAMYLRRFQDWRQGRDGRTMDDALAMRDKDGSKLLNAPQAIGVAIDAILAHHGQGKVRIDCARCRHLGDSAQPCSLGAVGDCSEFQPIEESVQKKRS